MKKKLTYSILLILVVLFIDQWLKIWVKTTFVYTHSQAVLGNWFELHFIENNGFAFGKEIGGTYGKLALTLFRLVAVSLLGYYIYTLVKDKAQRYRTGYILMVSLIFAGAFGNIIDSVFYGVFFSESNYHISTPAEFLPDGGGYAKLFYGRVVDMLHFPIIDTYLPDWVPVWGGERFEFFRPIFNVADSAITAGVLGILLFYRAELKTSSRDENPTQTESAEAEATSGEEWEEETENVADMEMAQSESNPDEINPDDSEENIKNPEESNL
ncbi:lipoprotein signal peptidase [bacterium]|nr:lipoprotein signal peptidase [bacterium]